MTRPECEDLVRLIVESFRDASNPSVEIAIEEIMQTFDDFATPTADVSGEGQS